MSSRLASFTALLMLMVGLMGCPAGGGGGGSGNGGGGEGQGGAQPSNSVLFENTSAIDHDQIPVTATEFYVSLSGTTGVSENLLVEPIAPGENEIFCCFADGVYDIRVVSESGEEAVSLNRPFEGPHTYRFSVTMFLGHLRIG